MEEQKFSFSDSFQKTKEYLETQLELARLKAISKSSRLMGALVLDATKLLLSLIIVFFLSLALGFFLGELMGSYALGFLSTAGIFILILLGIKAFEPKLEAKFMDLAIRKILGKWNEDEEKVFDFEEEMGAFKTKEEKSNSTTVKEDFETRAN